MIPPHNIEAEQAVLGGLLLNGSMMPIVLEQLSTEDFYKADHRAIFDALKAIHDSGDKPDVVLVRSKLAGKIEDEEYLFELTSRVPSSANTELHAKLVKDKAMARRIIQVASMALNDAQSGIPGDVIADLVSRAQEISVASNISKVATFADALDAWKNQPLKAGHPTGLEELDRLMNGGYHPGGFTLIGGDAKVGKTVLALDGIREAMRCGTNVLLLSRDQLWFHLAARLWSADTGIPRQFLTLDPKALEAEKLLREWPIWFHRGEYDVGSVCNAIKINVAEKKIRIWVLDYLQRMRYNGPETQARAAVMSAEALADVAQDTNTYGIVISRVTKPSQGMAKQHRFAGEAGVQNAADTMLFIEKAGKEEGLDLPRKIEVIGGRHCGDGMVLAVLQGEVDRYRAATEEEKLRWGMRKKKEDKPW